MKVSIKEIQAITEEYIKSFLLGADRRDINEITNHYLISEKAGITTHGLRKLIWDAQYFPAAYKNKWRKVLAMDNLFDFNMHGMIGALGIGKLCDFIVRNKKKLIAIHFNNLLPYGSLFPTAYKLSLKGFSSIIFNDTDKFMSLENGTDLLGTNPISLCFAADPPIILDMATSKRNINYAFNLRQYSPGTKLPENVYLNKNRKYTTDSKQVKYVSPMGDYKGFGLSLMIHLFSEFLTKKKKSHNHKTFLCSGMIMAFKSSNIDIEGAQKFINSLKDKYPSKDNFANLNKVARNGYVELDEQVYKLLRMI